jgi:Zn-dependent M28 family amino/carboxypeptidase
VIAAFCLPLLAAAGPADKVDADRLMQSIRELPAHRAVAGGEVDRAGLAATEDLLFKKLEALGLKPVRQRIHWDLAGRDPGGEGKARQWHNIIVDLPGTDLANEVLILGAHFDAVPGAPGADDDGTGVAAILEAARILKDEPMRRTVRLCLFNLEEPGMVGSGEYVHRVLTPKVQSGAETIVGMVAMDMLGYYSSEPNSQRLPGGIAEIPGVEIPTVGDFIAMGGIARHRDFSQAFARAMREASPGCKVVVADFFPIAPPDLLRSDHGPFLSAGLPAVILSDTAEFRSPHYHRSTDTIETIDKNRFAATVKAVIGATVALAEPVAAEERRER